MARREQGGHVQSREAAGAVVVGEKHAAEVALVDACAHQGNVQFLAHFDSGIASR